MDEIISNTLEAEEVDEHTRETERVLSVDKWSIETNARAIGLTAMGYDNEIGLWEELEHRNRPHEIS